MCNELFEMSMAEELVRHSELAFKMIGKRYEVVDCMKDNRVFSSGDVSTSNGIGFHPNGRSGCVRMDDDTYFGMRCDHLMIMDGWVEGSFSPAILLLANVYGNIEMKLIIFSDIEVSL